MNKKLFYLIFICLGCGDKNNLQFPQKTFDEYPTITDADGFSILHYATINRDYKKVAKELVALDNKMENELPYDNLGCNPLFYMLDERCEKESEEFKKIAALYHEWYKNKLVGSKIISLRSNALSANSATDSYYNCSLLNLAIMAEDYESVKNHLLGGHYPRFRFVYGRSSEDILREKENVPEDVLLLLDKALKENKLVNLSNELLKENNVDEFINSIEDEAIKKQLKKKRNRDLVTGNSYILKIIKKISLLSEEIHSIDREQKLSIIKSLFDNVEKKDKEYSNESIEKGIEELEECKNKFNKLMLDLEELGSDVLQFTTFKKLYDLDEEKLEDQKIKEAFILNLLNHIPEISLSIKGKVEELINSSLKNDNLDFRKQILSNLYSKYFSGTENSALNEMERIEISEIDNTYRITDEFDEGYIVFKVNSEVKKISNPIFLFSTLEQLVKELKFYLEDMIKESEDKAAKNKSPQNEEDKDGELEEDTSKSEDEEIKKNQLKYLMDEKKLVDEYYKKAAELSENSEQIKRDFEQAEGLITGGQTVNSEQKNEGVGYKVELDLINKKLSEYRTSYLQPLNG